MSGSHILAELVRGKRWDDVGRLANTDLIRIAMEDPDAWPAAFAALPPSWLQQHPRHVFLRSILEALHKPFTVISHSSYEFFKAWLWEQHAPLARDVIADHIGRMQFARALGNYDAAVAAVEAIDNTIREASEYTDFEDILPAVYIPVGATNLLVGDMGGAVAAFTEAVRWCVIGQGHPAERHARNYLALAYAVDGDYAQARKLSSADIGTRSGAVGSFAHVYESAALIVPALLAIGELDEAASERAIAAIDRPVDETEFWALSAHARARHALYWGDRAEAIESLEKLLVAHRALSGLDSLASAVLRANLADLHQSLGDLDAAERVLREAGASSAGLALLQSSRLRLSALRGDQDAVSAGLRELADSRGSGSALPTNLVVMSANAALARGEESAVDEFVRRAAVAIESRGDYAALTEAVPPVLDRLLVILGEERRPSRVLYVASERPVLTRRECEILQALQNNSDSHKALSAELYLSVNTVKTHLRNLYRKLGVQSREEALDAGRELRLLE